MTETQKLELKVQALLEKLSTLENQVADLRVELTVVSQERDELKEAVVEPKKATPGASR